MEGSVFHQGSRSDFVVNLIMADIGAGHFSAGERLGEIELASRYGVSRTPVREALRALAAIGVLERARHKGCTVAHPKAHQRCPKCRSESLRTLRDAEGIVYLCRACKHAWEHTSAEILIRTLLTGL